MYFPIVLEARSPQSRCQQHWFHFFFSLYSQPAAYGRSQAGGPIGATATGLHHSHGNARSEPCLWPTFHSSWQCCILNPLSRPGIKPTSSWTLYWVLNQQSHSGIPGLAHFESCQGECVPCLSCSCWQFAGHLGVPWHRFITQICTFTCHLCPFTQSTLCASLSLSLCPNFPFL